MKNDGYDIEFSNVGFSYETGDVVLKDVSFVAKQGEVTALIGPSGGGKTTVSRLASRFWDANRGSITVGGCLIIQFLKIYELVKWMQRMRK